MLLHAFPGADVPVVQLSIDLRRPPQWHVALGARLAALRECGVLLMASGNVVHNLRAIDWQREDHGFDWARRFDEHARQLLAERPGDAAALAGHPDYAMSAPTPEQGNAGQSRLSKAKTRRERRSGENGWESIFLDATSGICSSPVLPRIGACATRRGLSA